jgi:hypothetical protein
MQLIDIAGPKAILRGLLDVAGLDLSIHSASEQGEGTWRVSGYATDKALAELRRRGCTVTIVMDAEQVQAAIESGRPPKPPTY